MECLVLGPIATNCWIDPIKEKTENQRSCILIDPGADGDSIITRLKRRGLRPALVLLTHGHFDHVAALASVVRAFPDGPAIDIAIHSADAFYLGGRAKAAHLRDFASVGGASYVEGLWEELPAPTRFLSEGDRIGPFTVLHLPGHTAGSVGFYDPEGGRLFSGDTLFSGAVGRTDLPGGDGRALGRSLQRLWTLPAKTRVYPGHGDETTIGRERGTYA